MKERPFSMTGQEVRATREGRKTQVRRIVKPQKSPPHRCIDDDGWPCTEDEYGDWHRDQCPFGTVGDRLWVRETWRIASINHNIPRGQFCTVQFSDFAVLPHPQPEQSLFAPLVAKDVLSLGDTGIAFGKWRSPIHMPRWASRIDLEITGVRVERLQEITNNGAIDEGFPGDRWYEGHGEIGEMEPWEQFRDYWQSINGPGSWDANPWVWVLEFRRIEK